MKDKQRVDMKRRWTLGPEHPKCVPDRVPWDLLGTPMGPSWDPSATWNPFLSQFLWDQLG